MNEFFRTSTVRLAGFYLGLFATSVLVLLALIYWQTVVYIERQADDTIDAEIRVLDQQFRERGLDGLVETIADRSDPERGSSMLYLLTDSDGRPIAGNLKGWPDARVDAQGWMHFTLPGPIAPVYPNLDASGVPEPPGTASGSSSVTSSATKRGRHEAQATSFLLPHGYQLLVGRDMAELYNFRQRIVLALGWAAGITLCLGLAGGLVMSRSTLGRIEAINRASADLIAGETSSRIPVTGAGDEFDRLALNLNTMLDRIEQLVKGMREVTDNIAHDLRSPLGRLRSRIEVALREPASVERYRATLEGTIEAVDGLLATFNAVLEIAEADAGTLAVDPAPVDVAALVMGLGELYEPAAEEAGLRFETIAPAEPAPVAGNRQLLTRALANLIENAVKYTPPGGTIRVELAAGVPTHTLTVADTGPGIPPEMRERVFERFFRLEWSRTNQGNGLGLSLVKAIVRLHGGSVRLDDGWPGRDPPGLRVTLALPAASVGVPLSIPA